MFKPGKYQSFDSNYLDGLRGISALAVAIYHCSLYIGLAGTAAMSLPQFFWFTRNGYLGVPIFIVLSGFVLMLPSVRSSRYWFPKGFRTYIFRRFKRIVPPYWAALTLSLILIYLTPLLQSKSGTKWDDKLPITQIDIVGHYLLVQNFLGGPIRINGPMWSVAVEWQIYFIFAALILPTWMLLGKWFGFAAVSVLTLGPSLVLVLNEKFGILNSILGISEWVVNLHAHEHYIFLFAAGALAAEISSSETAKPRFLWIFAVLALCYVFISPAHAIANLRQTETLVGFSVALLLIWLAKNTSSRVARFLSAKPMLVLGNMSYSIYLIHSPLLALGNLLLLPLGLNLGIHAALMMLVVLPLSVCISWLFHLGVERRFMNTHQRELVSRLRPAKI